MKMKMTDTMRAAIGGAIAGATDRNEALSMVVAPVQELVSLVCAAQPTSVELATALHERYGIDFVFRGGKLDNVILN